MSGFYQWFAGFNPATGALPTMVWAAGAVALVGLVVFVCVFALDRIGGGVSERLRGPARNWIWRAALVLAGTLMLWTILDGPAARDWRAERRALEARATELTLRTLAPGSALACLDAVDSSAVADACETAVFGSAEATAAALAYVDARLTLLADSLRFAAHDASYEANLARLRRGIEADRFGLVAQVLATRGCGVGNCAGYKLLRDPARVMANLKGRTFEANVALHSAAWRGPAGAGSPMPPTSETGAAPVAEGGVPHGTPMSSRFDFPSASSIPAVSIMNPEPTTPPAAEHPPKPAAPAKRQTAREPPAPPMAITPAPNTASSGTLTNPR